MNNNGSPLSSSLEAALRRMPAPESVYDITPSISMMDQLRPSSANTSDEQAVADSVIQFQEHNPGAEVTEALTTTDILHALTKPDYDLGVSENDLVGMRTDPTSIYHAIATELDERIVTGNHSFTPTEGVEFVPPADHEQKAVVVRALHEIDIEVVGKGVEEALWSIAKFDQQAEAVVSASETEAQRAFQYAVDAYTRHQGTQAWMQKGHEDSKAVSAIILQRFESFREKRELAWEAHETSRSITSSIEVCQNNLRNLNINDVALNRFLAKLQQDDRENSQQLTALIVRYQEIQQTRKVDISAAYFRESDIDTFDLRRHIASPEQQANFDSTMQILLEGVPKGTPSDAPEAIRLQSSWSHLRDIIGLQLPQIQHELHAKSLQLTDSINATGKGLEQNEMNIAELKANIQLLLSQKRQHTTNVYEPALRVMTEALKELEESVGQAYVRSTQVASVTKQLESAQAAQIERRRELDEAERRQELKSIESPGPASDEYTGRRASKDVQVDDRRFPEPEAATHSDRWARLRTKLGSMVLGKDK
ncbi:MAG: hypothetical protein ABIR37_00060 [Candidatus Saccharimonadales bacterium]